MNRIRRGKRKMKKGIALTKLEIFKLGAVKKIVA